MGDFSDKAAMVTGAGSGIGRAIASAFAREGARVAVIDLNAEGARETVDAIRAAGGDAFAIACDVSDEHEVDRMFGEIVSRFGRVDCAVNNAGIDPEIHPEPDWDIALYDRIQAVNVRSVMLCMRLQTQHMKAKGGGSIVNLGSFAAIRGIASKPFYVASKHALMGLTRCAALQFARDNIIINAVCPGTTQTPILQANIDVMPNGKDMASRNPTGRFADPSEMAEAALFLSSSRARYIVGQALSVDGGISA